jgi:hypothetical protein
VERSLVTRVDLVYLLAGDAVKVTGPTGAPFTRTIHAVTSPTIFTKTIHAVTSPTLHHLAHRAPVAGLGSPSSIRWTHNHSEQVYPII